MAQNRHLASPRTWLLMGVLAALCNLGSLEVMRVLHYAVEDACEAQETGDLTTCFLCSHFCFVPGEFVSADMPLLPSTAGILEPPPLDAAVQDRPTDAASARAPPRTA